MSSPSGEGKEKMEAIALACSTACGAPGQCPCNPEACSCKSTCVCKKEKCGRTSKPADCTDGVCPKPGEASTGDCKDKAGACNKLKAIDCTNGECPPPVTTGECKDKAGTCNTSKIADCTNGECPPPAATGECKDKAGACNKLKAIDCTNGECPPPATMGECKDKAGTCNTSKVVDCTNGECPPPAAAGECKDNAGVCNKPKIVDCTNGECPPPTATGECNDKASATCKLKTGSDFTDGGASMPSASECKDKATCKDPTTKCKGEDTNNAQCDKKENHSKGNANGSSIMIWHAQTSPGESPQSQSPKTPAEQKTGDKPLPQGDNLKAVLFDIDGTIADSDPIHFLAFQEILVEAGYNGGVPITHEFFIRQMSGKLNYVIAQELLPDVPEEKRIEMMDEKEVRYRQMAAKDLQPIPGFHQFAEYVKKRGLRRAAVTNSPRLNAEQVLTALKITDFFELLVVGNECKRPKPFPDPYLEAINFFGVEPKQCFVLEDSPSGTKAGVAAGAPVVGLLTGHPGPVLKEAGASVLIKDYHDPALWAALGEAPCTQSCSKTQQSEPTVTNNNTAALTVPVSS